MHSWRRRVKNLSIPFLEECVSARVRELEKRVPQDGVEIFCKALKGYEKMNQLRIILESNKRNTTKIFSEGVWKQFFVSGVYCLLTFRRITCQLLWGFGMKFFYKTAIPNPQRSWCSKSSAEEVKSLGVKRLGISKYYWFCIFSILLPSP